jgi:4-alpha-glucanotransferase
MVTTTTHDLPTVAGWWKGRDLDWRGRLGLFADAGDDAAGRAARIVDRAALWNAFVHAGLVESEPPQDTAAVVDAAMRFVRHAPSTLAIFPLEDVARVEEQPNLPGTVEHHPNWRRRLPASAMRNLPQPATAPRANATAGSVS